MMKWRQHEYVKRMAKVNYVCLSCVCLCMCLSVFLFCLSYFCGESERSGVRRVITSPKYLVVSHILIFYLHGHLVYLDPKLETRILFRNSQLYHYRPSRNSYVGAEDFAILRFHIYDLWDKTRARMEGFVCKKYVPFQTVPTKSTHLFPVNMYGSK